MLRRTISLMVMCAPLAACSVAEAPVDDTNALTSSTYAMPKSIVAYENQMGWGKHHLKWHTERQWNLLDPSDRTWAVNQGWKAATIQEGAPGNGLEFLAMHRVMIHTLLVQFPSNAALFKGWPTIPTAPNDKTAPKTTDPFSDDMKAAIDKIENHPEAFKTDDEFGLFLETKLRPTTRSPSARTTDTTAGIHNYVHNRFADSSSPIDLGDPSVNLQNKVFWRLHGWIDARWGAFRKAKGFSETDADYVAALAKAQKEMMDSMKLGGPKGAPEDPPPASLREMFENESN